jgi:HSP20 family protein
MVRLWSKANPEGYGLHVQRKRRDIDRLQGEIQELFADLWQVPRFSGLRSGFRPQVDSYRTSDPPQLTVLIEVPGVDAESIDLTIADGALTVSGERARPRCEGLVYQQMELEYGPFRRQVQLPDGIDVGAARATYDRGVLKVVIPMRQRSATGERVAIEVTHS